MFPILPTQANRHLQGVIMDLLKMTDITKEFPGVKALDKVSLTVKAGTVAV